VDIAQLPMAVLYDWRHRKADGFFKWVWIDIRGTVRFYWQNRWLWRVMRLVPGWVKYWAVVEAATRGEQGNPGYVTSLVMMERIEAMGWWWRPRAAACSADETSVQDTRSDVGITNVGERVAPVTQDREPFRAGD
jgi:hypothetical protein